ncbi:MAG: RagB/SusD family nutrient uptake outer membrane protein [Chitinophagaceae bacterium]
MKCKQLLLLAVFTSSVLGGCTKLDEKLQGDLTLEQAQRVADVNAMLKGAYNGLRSYQTQDLIWCLQTLTTDEGIPPTRGGDWDDNGVWRVLHTHTWTAENDRISGTFNSLLGTVFASTNLLNFKPTAQQAAESKFIRAFVMFTVLDIWNQVPFRQPGENLLNPPQVLVGPAALDFIIAELNAIMNDLPDNGPTTAYQANKNAARALLMKCYLNRGVVANRASPTFAAADMAQVITLADQIINSNKYALDPDYFDNFAPDNDTKSSELIFTNLNNNSEAGNVRFHYHCGTHYSQTPEGGWNGFTTLSDFYDKFDAADKRLGAAYPGSTDLTGLRVGFLFGQQFDRNGNPLKDRNGNNLSFTKAVKLVESGPTLEVTGIRVAKYAVDAYSDAGTIKERGNAKNDYVMLRYADVLLMKAEAQLRSSLAAGALTTTNLVRTIRGVPTYTSVTLDNIYDERGREMYWEGYRRQDMIRFGKFLAPFQEKPAASPAKALLFPIPSGALAVNPNLQQNPGY